MKNRLSNLPSIVWVALIPIGLILFVGGIIFFFQAIATVEGFASILFLLIGFFIVKASTSDEIKNSKNKGSGFALAMGIVFFALMGMAIDQPGNVIYNKPIEILFCPRGSFLARDTITSHPLPGRTDITQSYDCVDESGDLKQSIDVFHVILVRFVEYVIIGYVLVGISRLINLNKRKPKQTSSHIIS